MKMYHKQTKGRETKKAAQHKTTETDGEREPRKWHTKLQGNT